MFEIFYHEEKIAKLHLQQGYKKWDAQMRRHPKFIQVSFNALFFQIFQPVLDLITAWNATR